MAQNFIACDRGQTMLMPPDLADWVPEDHVVWSILGAVDQMDLSAFYGAYRENGQGRAAYEPSMVAVPASTSSLFGRRAMVPAVGRSPLRLGDSARRCVVEIHRSG
jgi:hypothetical protein